MRFSSLAGYNIEGKSKKAKGKSEEVREGAFLIICR
jgi:hypothetical protein